MYRIIDSADGHVIEEGFKTHEVAAEYLESEVGNPDAIIVAELTGDTDRSALDLSRAELREQRDMLLAAAELTQSIGRNYRGNVYITVAQEELEERAFNALDSAIARAKEGK